MSKGVKQIVCYLLLHAVILINVQATLPHCGVGHPFEQDRHHGCEHGASAEEGLKHQDHGDRGLWYMLICIMNDFEHSTHSCNAHQYYPSKTEKAEDSIKAVASPAMHGYILQVQQDIDEEEAPTYPTYYHHELQEALLKAFGRRGPPLMA